jgi:hypothetical protein
MNTQVPTMHSNPRVNAYLLADEQWAAHAQDLWKYSSDFDFTVKCSDLYTARCEAEAQLTVIERHMARRAAGALDDILAVYGNSREYYEGLSEDYHYNFDNRQYVKHFDLAAANLHRASLPLFALGFTLSDLDRLYRSTLETVDAQVKTRYTQLTFTVEGE